MSSLKEMNEGLVVPGRISIPFSYAAGETGSRFLTELRDHQRIMAVRCPGCDRVRVPPQRVCIHCFVESDEWVELSNEGLLLAHTWVRKPKSHHPPIDPLIYGVIRLEGADSNLIHLVRFPNPDDLLDGIKVRAVFSETRTGGIFDIKYFRPV